MPVRIFGGGGGKIIKDATATASDIKIGKVAYGNKNQRIVGTGIMIDGIKNSSHIQAKTLSGSLGAGYFYEYEEPAFRMNSSSGLINITDSNNQLCNGAIAGKIGNGIIGAIDAGNTIRFFVLNANGNVAIVEKSSTSQLSNIIRGKIVQFDSDTAIILYNYDNYMYGVVITLNSAKTTISIGTEIRLFSADRSPQVAKIASKYSDGYALLWVDAYYCRFITVIIKNGSISVVGSATQLSTSYSYVFASSTKSSIDYIYVLGGQYNGSDFKWKYYWTVLSGAITKQSMDKWDLGGSYGWKRENSSDWINFEDGTGYIFFFGGSIIEPLMLYSGYFVDVVNNKQKQIIESLSSRTNPFLMHEGNLFGATISKTYEKYKFDICSKTDKMSSYIGYSDEIDIKNFLDYGSILCVEILGNTIFMIFRKKDSSASNGISELKYLKISNTIPFVKQSENKINGVTKTIVNTSSGECITM